MAEVVKLQCEICGKHFERNKADYLRGIKRGRKKVCCSLDCARQSNRLPESQRKRKSSNSGKERCPECGKLGVKIMHTSVNSSAHRLRRKECMKCDYRFTTYEVLSEEYNKYFKATDKVAMCFECIHNNGKVCSLGLPEYMTYEAHDCIHV